ncbi:hypothetical protein D5086_005193 [Populus alba]|uniref:Uncharacterized protein n=1 Tax=Populus alba TaxID=43335 RepID=A0ACC4CUN3_POPAL
MPNIKQTENKQVEFSQKPNTCLAPSSLEISCDHTKQNNSVMASTGDAGKSVEEAGRASAVGVLEWFCRTEVLCGNGLLDLDFLQKCAI